MSVREVLGLHPTDNPKRWELRVRDGMVTPGGALQGGAAFGATVEAMAAATGRPLVWATAQFVSHAAPDSILDIDIDVAVAGHRVTQARCRLTDDGDDVMRVTAAFGARDLGFDHIWAAPPAVSRPEECPVRTEALGGLAQGWEARRALGRAREDLDGAHGPGRSASWLRRLRGRGPVAPGELAVVGDLSVLELSDAVGFPCLGNSLDNTLRMVESSTSAESGDRAETEWILLDASVSSVTNGFGAVTAHLWSEEGALLAVFSQTLVLRRLDEQGQSVRTTKRFAGNEEESDATG